MKKLFILLVLLSSCTKKSASNYKADDCVWGDKHFYKVYFVGDYGIGITEWNRNELKYQNGKYVFYWELNRFEHSDCPDKMVFKSN